MNPLGGELDTIKTVHEALEPHDEQARRRILAYVGNLLGIDAQPAPHRVDRVDGDGEGQSEKEAGHASTESKQSFSSFADFFEATKPNTGGEKALVAGYWLQVHEGEEGFTAAAAHKELTHLGHKLTNITSSITGMKDRKPALILQVRKRGSSRQARKIYKVSAEGEKRVEEMIGG